MVSKFLKKMEVLQGFICIPTKSRPELIGNTPLPCVTTLNGNPARLDKYGRLWSPFLKGKFPIGYQVHLVKSEQGFQIEPITSKLESAVLRIESRSETGLFGAREKMLGEERKVLFRNLANLPSTTYATFGLYRYPAKFIPHVIAYVLENYAQSCMKVFDPFAGCGTVGVVSRIYGYDYELWDLNPLLETLHSVATLEPKKVDVKKLLHQLATSNEEFVPKWSRLYYWFPQEFLPLLYRVWGFYHSMDDEYLKLLLTIPLVKTTRYFSYDDMQRQKLSKSPKSEQRVNLLLTCDWKTKFFKMVEQETEKVIKRIEDHWMLSPKQTEAIVKGGVDTLSMNLTEEKDILITSPPYLQSHEYIRQAKMDLFWLGHSEDEVRKLSKLEIPYRDVEPQPVHSETFSSWRGEIEENHMRKLFDRYFWGVLGALTRLQEKVSPYLFLFVGRASMRGRPVPIDRIFAEHFVELGWVHEGTLIDTIVARRMFSYRINPATKLKDRRTPVENLVILRKP
ncbi:MAG: hypothetical protein AOA66_0877 [Candidatus Bathyarchaeota archaeon BA2]|nr:MAG: hypothetical protein AOA66_0877 [Candidatus Bathyarchaeota archaeon BA2]